MLDPGTDTVDLALLVYMRGRSSSSTGQPNTQQPLHEANTFISFFLFDDYEFLQQFYIAISILFTTSVGSLKVQTYLKLMVWNWKWQFFGVYFYISTHPLPP